MVHPDQLVVDGPAPIPQHLPRYSDIVTDWDLLWIRTLKIGIIYQESVIDTAVSIHSDEMADKHPGQRGVVASPEVPIPNS
jgi:hypothetical protein